MSHTLHLFNPWHDEALAANVQFYSPSLAGRKLAHVLAELPRIWGEEDDEYLIGRKSIALIHGGGTIM